MKVGLLVIGDEILSGKRRDKHMARFIELLAERGMELHWAQYLGDDRELLVAKLREVFASGDLVVSCGGIGATPDDHTRQAAAAASGANWPCTRRRAADWERVQELDAEGPPPDPDRRTTCSAAQMGVFPVGAGIPNRTTRSGFLRQARTACRPSPCPAHPMMAWADGPARRTAPPRRAPRAVGHRAGRHGSEPHALMEAVEQAHPGIKVFSLPSVDHPQWGRCIELGVKGAAGGSIPPTLR